MNWHSCLQNVHPFQFLRGTCNDSLYESEVRVCAQAFADDAILKAKVQSVASDMFAQLATAPESCQEEEASFMHMGLKFTVRCAVTRSSISEEDRGFEDSGEFSTYDSNRHENNNKLHII